MYRPHPSEPFERPQDPSPDPSLLGAANSAHEAKEHLRVIRQAMERSTKYSTLSGLSGVAVGCIALVGCLLTQYVVKAAPEPQWKFLFVGVWMLVLAFSLLADYLLSKRRAAHVGKTARSPLGKHLMRAAAPGFLAAVAFSAFYALKLGSLGGYTMAGAYLYGAWMLCYSVSLLSVGMFSVREVSYLGWAFLIAGCATLLLPSESMFGPRAMMALTFGGFHIAYGLWMGRKYGW